MTDEPSNTGVIMKKLLLASVCLLLPISASAADLSYKKARGPAYHTVSTWTGFYVGANAGYSFGANTNDSGAQSFYNNTNDPVGTTEVMGAGGPAWHGRANYNGASGGLQAGYNYQLSPWSVVGVEADIQGADITSGFTQSNTTAINLFPVLPGAIPNLWPVTGTATVTDKINWFGTVRGRIGVTSFENTLLLYATGGLAYGQVQQNFQYTGGFLADAALGFGGSNWNGSTSTSQFKTGYTVGAGVEWKPHYFGDNWSFKAEYLYTDLGSTSLPIAVAAFRNSDGAGNRLVNASNSMENAFQTVRVGVNYHFN